MRIELQTRRYRRLSLTSLIDVIFLLLLFFMLSSTFTRFASIDVSGAAAGQAATDTRPDIIIKIFDDAWAINGQQHDGESAMAALSALEQQGAKSAVLFFDAKATSQQLVTALEAIRAQTEIAVSVSR